MEEIDSRTYTEFVVRQVRAAGEGGMLGSQLGLALRNAFPDFNLKRLGYANLRALLERIPELRLERAAGSPDLRVVAGQVPATERGATRTGATGDEVWRAWVSPRSPYVIEVGARGGIVSVVRATQPRDADAHYIEPMPAEAHRQLARDFLAELPEEEADPLRGLVDDASDEWWRRWSDALRRTPRLWVAWGNRRRLALTTELEQRLAATGLPRERVDRLLHERQLPKARPIEAGGLPRSPAPIARSTASEADSLAALRRVVRDVVEQLSVDEMRALRLPLGPVLDALQLDGRNGK